MFFWDRNWVQDLVTRIAMLMVKQYMNELPLQMPFTKEFSEFKMA
jgi:hypothetical protein